MIDISSYQPCERCKSCEALFICQQCQPLRSFCSKCDTSVHMLPSKKGHQRDSVELMRSRSQFKPKENIDNIPTSYSTLRQSNEQNFMNQERSLVQCPCTLGSSYPQCITSTPRTSYVESKHYEGGRVYTRDYVNELKSIHEKEKEELIFKINALENNLERLKIGFTDQIQKMQNSVEECNRTNFNLIKQNEEEGEAKLKRVIEDKNSQIENTNLRISELKESNEDLLQKIEHVEKQKDKIETKFNKQLKELERELEHKNRQMEKMKSDYNDRIEISEKRNLETRREIREEYEREVNTQRLDFDSEIEMLQRKIEEKNREFKEMVDQKNNDDNYYNKLINELKIDLKFAQEEIKLCKFPF